MSKRSRAVSAALITGVLVAACGGGDSDSASDGTVKMVLWPGPEGEAMQQVVDEYNTGQGQTDGVRVDMTLLSRSDTFSKQATLMSQSSSEFDVYFTASYLIAQHAPYLEPLDVDVSDYFPVVTESLTVEDTTYALPLDVSNHFLIYRTDLIDSLLDDESAHDVYGDLAEQLIGQRMTPKHPDEWDWDDMIVAAAYFTQSHNPDSPTRYGTALQARNLLFNTMIWNNVLWSEGGSWLDDGGAPALSSDAGRRAVEVYRTIYDKGLTSPDSSQAEFPETQAALTSGSAAFAIQWSAAYAELDDPEQSPETAGRIGIAPVPGPEHRTHVHALAVGINKDSDRKDAAAAWLEYLATDEAMSAYAAAGAIPSNPSILEAHADQNPIFPYIADHLDEYGYSPPALPRTYDIYVALADTLSAAWVGQGDVDAALAAADDAIAQLVDAG
ncbi:ABC transporter substrate-binding protein [Phytoactinopolyspora limicola]|uniref:ABC transporter substrate-binding protein n=1 Tax=Phytoactinopolyspora limicola TaxID=2715536 RepID=UPI00140991CE|nr:extracellular solute-binding protein [Phytoactinopolyspora limicola]